MFTYTLTLLGNDFQPTQIEFFSTLNVNTFCDPDSPEYDYGYLCINGESIIELVSIAKKILGNFSKSIESIEIDVIYFYDQQCNLEFSNKEIKLISDIGACLNLSCEKNS